MSNYGYNYPEDPNEGSGNYSYPPQPGGGYPPKPGPYQGYPVGPPQNEGSLQPQNLGWKESQRGKIGTNSTPSGYYNCASWGWRALAGLIDYGPLTVLNFAVASVFTNLAPTIGYDAVHDQCDVPARDCARRAQQWRPAGPDRPEHRE